MLNIFHNISNSLNAIGIEKGIMESKMDENIS